MKRLVFILVALFSLTCNAQDNFKVEGTTFTQVSKGRKSTKSEPIATGCTWVDSKGNQYPVFMSESGSCFVIKTSKKTGKEYKNYLGKDVSKAICKKIGKEYKGK